MNTKTVWHDTTIQGINENIRTLRESPANCTPAFSDALDTVADNFSKLDKTGYYAGLFDVSLHLSLLKSFTEGNVESLFELQERLNKATVGLNTADAVQG